MYARNSSHVKVPYRVHNRLSVCRILSQMNFILFHCNIHLRLLRPVDLFPSGIGWETTTLIIIIVRIIMYSDDGE